MTLGDSLVAATALAYQLTLVTRNTNDFDWIEDLPLLNPFATRKAFAKKHNMLNALHFLLRHQQGERATTTTQWNRYVSLIYSAEYKETPMMQVTIHIISTGGTIAATPSGMLTPHELLAVIPTLPPQTRISTEAFRNIGSSRITPADWVSLALHIQAIVQTRPDVNGIVVTHGTDTLEETAYFLQLTLTVPCPVIMTGSMRRADALGTDGPANLYQALLVATSPDPTGRGVFVVLNNEIHAPREVTKTHTLRLDTFASPVVGALGSVDGDTVTWLRQPHRPRSMPLSFALSPNHLLPRVDIVYSYAGADDVHFRALIDAGTRGIIVATFGSGRVTEAQETAIRHALACDVVVVMSSRVGSGRVEPNYPDGLSPAGTQKRVVLAGDLNPQKARVLLMLALTQTHDQQQIQALFDIY